MVRPSSRKASIEIGACLKDKTLKAARSKIEAPSRQKEWPKEWCEHKAHFLAGQSHIQQSCLAARCHTQCEEIGPTSSQMKTGHPGEAAAVQRQNYQTPRATTPKFVAHQPKQNKQDLSQAKSPSPGPPKPCLGGPKKEPQPCSGAPFFWVPQTLV